MNLCQPELQLDAESLNARLTRLEDQIRSGCITVAAAPVTSANAPAQEEEERPPMPDDRDAPPVTDEPIAQAAPMGFWTDIVDAVRRELKPPASGFISRINGVLRGNDLILQCSNFNYEIINKPEILSLVGQKASAKLGRPINVKAVDMSAKPQASKQMDQLLSFGKAHGDIVRIKHSE